MPELFLFDPGPVPSVAIEGRRERYPVRRIFCVGRNYLAHAAEMGARVDKATQQPFYFTKSPAHVVESGATVPYAPGTANLHHEIELVVALGETGFEVAADDAEQLVYGFAVGLDMTRRDLQFAAREANKPWDIAKDFEDAAVLSPIVPRERCGPIERGRIELAVNDEKRQSADVSQLIWNVREILAHLSRYYRLGPGDLVFTGTPKGVGPVVAGDRLRGRIDGVGEIARDIGRG